MNIDYIVDNLIYIFLPCVNIDAMNEEKLIIIADYITGIILKLCMILIIVTMFVTSLDAISAIKKINNIEADLKYLKEDYKYTVQENDLIWSYIENVDTYKSIDDAIKYRDDLINHLQFIDE